MPAFSKSTLFIIGNGFDQFHKLETSYEDYRNWLKENHPKTISRLNNTDIFCINKDGRSFDDNPGSWSDLEQSLALDLEKKLKDLIKKYGTPDFSEYWDEMRDEVESETEFLRDFTGAHFYEWLLHAESKVTSKVLMLNRDAVFLTFNYTRTLENVYSIATDRILHVHGKLDDSVIPIDDAPVIIGDTSTMQGIESCIIIGPEIVNSCITRSCIQFGTPSNGPVATEERLLATVEREAILEGFDGVMDLLKEASENTFKDIEANKQSVSEFLASSNITDVVILGHNFSGIDWPYYDETLIPMLRDAKWWIASRSKTGKNDAVERLRRHGVDATVIPRTKL